MNAEEALNYIQANDLECEMTDVLLFNDLDFYFIPMVQPGLTPDKPGSFYLSSLKNDYNYLSSDYCNMTFSVGEICETAPKIYYHPEHLVGYIARYKNQIEGRIEYYKKSDAANVLRLNVIKSFFCCMEDEKGDLSKEYILDLIRKSKRIRNGYKRETDSEDLIVDIDILFDRKIINYIKNDSIKTGLLHRIYVDRLIDLQLKLSFGKCSLIASEVYLTGGFKPTSILFYTDIIYPEKIFTNLESTISIIDSKDTIPNILFDLSMRLNAKVLRIATGYIYDSGLKLLEPTLNTVGNRNGEISFYVGALQHYPKASNDMNRSTAKLINEYLRSKRLDNLFTYTNGFLHGKHYYIANDEEAYVIIGSSNVTYSAYYNNYEFNIIHHVKKEDDIYSLWFDDLEEKSIKIDYLDETAYEQNIIQDEGGTSKGDSIYRKLTTEEQKKRYEILLRYNPSQVHENCFQGSRGFKPFKKYSVFEYEEKRLFVLESFDFGNACYFLQGESLMDIKAELRNKTKTDIQNSDHYLTHVVHESAFEDTIKEILES